MKMAVTAAAAVVAVAAAAMVAALLSSPDALRDVAVLEIGGGDGDGRVELVPVDAGAAGPESLAFDPAGGGPYAGVSDGRVLRWVPGERRWEEHSASYAPELYVRLASSLVFLACMTRACAIRFFFLAIMLCFLLCSRFGLGRSPAHRRLWFGAPCQGPPGGCECDVDGRPIH